MAAASANAADCGGSEKLDTTRTIIVDPSAHPRIGTMSYQETLPLRDKEVVLTFDDGPAQPYTDRVLDILGADCVRATFFIVGRMAKVHPELVRRAYAEGHTIGTHTMNHPLRFRALPAARAQQEIDDGINAVTTALGDATRIAPFFRFPGFARTDPAENYLASRHLMVWAADFPADDWRKIGVDGVVRRAMDRLEAKGKGILLLHDIHERTVEALPIILKELKTRGFHVVHVVPAASDRPASEATAEEWKPKWRPQPASEEVAASVDNGSTETASPPPSGAAQGSSRRAVSTDSSHAGSVVRGPRTSMPMDEARQLDALNTDRRGGIRHEGTSTHHSWFEWMWSAVRHTFLEVVMKVRGYAYAS